MNRIDFCLPICYNKFNILRSNEVKKDIAAERRMSA